MRFVMVLLLPWLAYALTLGEVLPHVRLAGEDGGHIDGKPFDSKALVGKVRLIIYSDPDKRNLNEAFFARVKSLHLDRSRYGSVAIINMAATWLPNYVLEAILQKKQKEYPDTLYVKDMYKVLVKAWDIADENQDIIITDKEGRVLFYKAGKLSPAEQERAITILQGQLQ